MAGVAEVDEPFAVEAARHVFQNADAPDAPLVVVDQFVVGGEDVCYTALGSKRRDMNRDTAENARI